MAKKSLSHPPRRVEPNRVLEALGRACTDPKMRPSQPEECELSEPALPCAAAKGAPGPEVTVLFREPVRLIGIPLVASDPVEHESLSIACTPLPASHVTAGLTLDLLYEQRWFFQDYLVGPLSCVVPLAPGETLRLRLLHSQRKTLEQNTLDETEQTDTTESTVIDRDVLNVTRSSSRTDNWQVTGNGTLGIPEKASVGLQASVGSTLVDASSSTAERTSETTHKSSSNLKLLHKIEVREVRDEVLEREAARVIVNPYRDRAISLRIFDVGKRYCVEFSLARVAPAFHIRIKALRFDREFVLSNGAFLAEYLQEQDLYLALRTALDGIPHLPLRDAETKAIECAKLCLKYLFDQPNIFNVPSLLLPGSDPNSPGSSFDATASANGLQAAKDQNLATVFTTLNMYYHVYKNEVPSNSHMALDLALSLEAALTPAWPFAEDTLRVATVQDASRRTEAFRRLGGFLAMVKGILRPLTGPLADETEARQAMRSAEVAMDRVVRHLHCHAEYYTSGFLVYLARTTKSRAIQVLATDVFRLAGGAADGLSQCFDVTRAFTWGATVVVPGRREFDAGSVPGLLAKLNGVFGADQVVLTMGKLRKEEVVTASDGSHIEAVASDCVLQGVPEAPPPGPIRVSVSDEGK